MATANKQKYQCATCDRFIELPRVLDCGHLFCKRCYSRHHNEYVLHVLKPSRAKGHQEPPEFVPCNECQLMSRIPGSGAPGGVSDLLSALRSSSGSVQEVRSGPELEVTKGSNTESQPVASSVSPSVATTGTMSKSGSQGVVTSKPPILLWHSTKYPHIYDSTFFNEGNLACITYDERQDGEDGCTLDNLQLRVLDIHGQDTQLPFPVFLTEPCAVSGSLEGNSLAVVDWPGGGKYIIHVYSRVGTRWRASQITTTSPVSRVSLAPSGDCLCGSADEVMLYNKRGEMLWSIPLPGEGDWLPHLCITHSGQIIIMNTKQLKITVHDMSGNKISEFPSQFVKEPGAICVDSRDQVLVMDWATSEISLFSADGDYIQPIMQDVVCGGMSLYLDKYLLMESGDNGLYLYEL